MSGIDPLHMAFHDSENAGPTDATHPMHKTYASKAWIWCLFVYSVVTLLISLFFLGYCLTNLLATGEDPSEPIKSPNPTSSAAGPSGPAAQPGTPPSTAGPTGGQPTGSTGTAGPQPTGASGSTGTLAADPSGPTGQESTESQSGKSQARMVWELYLFLAAAAAGMLGGALHLATSLGQYVGARRFLRSWGIFYILRPLISAALGVFILFVLRAGVVSQNVPSQSYNLFGILLFCGLGGLFSRQAMEKLAEIFDSLFRTAKPKARPTESAVMTGSRETASDLSAPLKPTGSPAAESFPQEERIEPPKD